MIRSFLDELTKIGSAGALVGLVKQADSLMELHNDFAPSAIEVNPKDASTRLPFSGDTKPVVGWGALGGVTASKDPIDRQRWNRVWSDSGR